MQTPITAKKLKDHFNYSWWKYALLLVLAIMGWSIFYTITSPKTPENKKIIVGVYSAGFDSNLSAYMQQLQEEQFPEMQQMEPMFILPDVQQGAMILTTRMASKQCDLYILPRQEFQSWASQGAFLPLETAMPELVAELKEAGVGLSRGYTSGKETSEEHLYGIPCRDLPSSLYYLWTDPTDMYISIFVHNGNDENVLHFTEAFVRDLLKEPPVNTETESSE